MSPDGHTETDTPVDLENVPCKVQCPATGETCQKLGETLGHLTDVHSDQSKLLNILFSDYGETGAKCAKPKVGSVGFCSGEALLVPLSTSTVSERNL